MVNSLFVASSAAALLRRDQKIGLAPQRRTSSQQATEAEQFASKQLSENDVDIFSACRLGSIVKQRRELSCNHQCLNGCIPEFFTHSQYFTHNKKRDSARYRIAWLAGDSVPDNANDGEYGSTRRGSE